MATVFVVQDSPGKNLLPAKEHGNIEVMLCGNEDIPRAIRKLTDALTSFKDGDALLLVGHPLNIGVAVHIVAQLTNGKFSVLIWERNHYTYRREEIEL